MIEEASALYGVAPAEFIAERNRVVKELKAAGRADDAAAVAALRKPRVSEHALNLAARDDPALAQRFADAASAATAAQAAAIGGGGADALREANRELRSATVELIDTAVARLSEHGRGGAAQRDEIEEVVRSLTSASGRHLLVAGVLGSASVDADDLFAGALADGAPPPRPAASGRSRAETATAPSRSTTTEASSRREKATGASRARAEPARARADAEPKRVDAAEARADAARRRRLDADRTRAKAALRQAETHRSAVERELESLRRRLADAERRVTDSEAALTAAGDAVEAARADLAALDDGE